MKQNVKVAVDRLDADIVPAPLLCPDGDEVSYCIHSLLTSCPTRKCRAPCSAMRTGLQQVLCLSILVVDPTTVLHLELNRP